jgi:hypothetical protein
MHCWLGMWAWERAKRLARARSIPGLIPTLANYSGNRVALREHHSATWGHVWLMVSSAAVISKILWPKEKKRQNWSSLLRKRLDLPPIPELQKLSRGGVRDALEHVEQSALGWQRTLVRRGIQGDIGSWAIGDGSIPPEREWVPPERCFRYLNSKTWELRVGVAKCNLKELAVDLMAVEGTVHHEANVLVRMPYPRPPEA